MNVQKDYWTKLYESKSAGRPKYDLWLDQYENILNKSIDTPIIDLGCGLGNDTLYLKERGYDVISCDFSEQALEQLSSIVDHAHVECFDLKAGLPFEDCSAKVIISDLSLHYFSWVETQSILEEIYRVLMNEGVLLCRVNSTNDTNYGAGEGVRIEENFYDINGNFKRFFNETQLKQLFKGWDIQYIKETEMSRYKMSKIVWEIAIQKS